MKNKCRHVPIGLSEQWFATKSEGIYLRDTYRDKRSDLLVGSTLRCAGLNVMELELALRYSSASHAKSSAREPKQAYRSTRITCFILICIKLSKVQY